MVRWCAVLGCSQKKRNKKGDSLFKLPAVIRHSDEMARKMSERRRIRWLARINRKDLTASQLCESRSSLLVCSRHFVSGKPSGLFEDKSIDWAPSLHLGHGRDAKRETEPEELQMDCTPSQKKKTVYDDMDWVTVRVELSKQKAKLQRCATKLKTLSSQRDKLIGKIECLQILANIDLDLLGRTINVGKHPEAKEDWDKLYCLVMSIRGEDEEVKKMCVDLNEEEKISDVEDAEDKSKRGSGRGKRRGQKQITGVSCRDVACQCQEKKKNSVQAIGVQTDVNIFTQLPSDLTSKNKEQVYLVLEYGKDGKDKVKVTAADDSDRPEKQELQSHSMANEESSVPGGNGVVSLSGSSLSKDESSLMPTGCDAAIQIPGVSSDPVKNVIPVTPGGKQKPMTANVQGGVDNEKQEQTMGMTTTSARPVVDLPPSSSFEDAGTDTQDINMPDFSSEPIDMMPMDEDPEDTVIVPPQNIVRKELKKESEPLPTTPTPTIPSHPIPQQDRKSGGPHPTRSVIERKVVIKKIQHPFLVQSPSNSTALVMSNSNRGGQYKVFRRETICKICGKVFPSMMDQQIHARLDHLGKKVYECELCGKKFSYENDLRRHTMYHTKQKNYQCSECGKTFVSHPGLASHIESVHRGVKHRCEICGQEYNRKNSLRIHMAGKHNLKKQTQVLPPPPPLPTQPPAIPPPPPPHLALPLPLPHLQQPPPPHIPPPQPQPHLPPTQLQHQPPPHLPPPPAQLSHPPPPPPHPLPPQLIPPSGDLLDLDHDMSMSAYSGNLL